MIQWYPGHMAKAIKEIEEKIKLVDLIIILLDARIPYSSYNPLFDKLFNNKSILYIMTKKDKADDKETNLWLNYYQNKGSIIALDVRNPKNTDLIIKKADSLLKAKREKDALKGLKPRPIKTMIVGIPNVGKSTLVNSLANKKVTSVGNKPGITKQQQWIRINQNFELLDTPGVLWPKFEDPKVAHHLAITGAIKDDILPVDEVAYYLIDLLKNLYPHTLSNKYNIDESLDKHNILDVLGNKQHFLLYNKEEVDHDKTARWLIQEYRDDKLGRLSLDQYRDLIMKMDNKNE